MGDSFGTSLGWFESQQVTTGLKNKVYDAQIARANAQVNNAKASKVGGVARAFNYGLRKLDSGVGQYSPLRQSNAHNWSADDIANRVKWGRRAGGVTRGLSQACNSNRTFPRGKGVG